MFDGPQRQRHGVTKHLVEGDGGLVVGVAAVLLLRGWLSGRRATPARAAAPTPAPTPNAAASAAPEKNRMNGDQHV